MVKYIIIHNKHQGCYDFHCYEDEIARLRMTSITINPPIIFMFNTRDEAQDFFEDYINDIDCIDIKCKKGEDVEHVESCTCGCVELDEDENPVLFYNKKNQIFLLEHGPQVFMPQHELKNDMKNLNLTNSIIRKCKSLSREQRKKYIELGKYCEDCNIIGKDQGEVSDDEDKGKSIFDDDNLKKNKKEQDPKKVEEENIVITISNPSNEEVAKKSEENIKPSKTYKKKNTQPKKEVENNIITISNPSNEEVAKNSEENIKTSKTYKKKNTQPKKEVENNIITISNPSNEEVAKNSEENIKTSKTYKKKDTQPKVPRETKSKKVKEESLIN
jgi:hypothetical protein